jgi:hypothetical protein
VTIKCPKDNIWVTQTRTLFCAGLIHNVTRCTITSGEIRTLAVLHGVRHANVDAPAVYVPESLPVLSAHEFPHVEAAHAMEVNELDQLKDRLAQVQKSLDVDTLVHIQKSTLQKEAQPHRHLIIAPLSCILAILLVIGVLRSKLRCATSCVRARLSLQRIVRPGPRLILSLFPKTRQPRSIRNRSL